MTVKISNLPAATSVGSGDIIPVVQSGTTKKVDLDANWSFGGDVNFDSGTLFVDASADRVGIGTTSPETKLQVEGNILLGNGNKIYSDGSSRGNLQISDPYSRSGVAERPVTFGNNLSLVNDPNVWEQDADTIGGSALVMTAKNNNYGEFLFYAAQDPDIGTSIVERMRIDSSGNVGIDVSNPARKLHVSDTMRLEPRATAPSSPAKGDIYFDSSDDKLKCYDGSTWQNLY